MFFVGSIVISITVLYYFYALMLFEAFHKRQTSQWVVVLFMIVGSELALLYYLYEVEHGPGVPTPDAGTGWWSVGSLVLGTVAGYAVYLFEKSRQEPLEERHQANKEESVDIKS